MKINFNFFTIALAVILANTLLEHTFSAKADVLKVEDEAILYPFLPASGMALGKGYLPGDVTASNPHSCFEFTTTRLENGGVLSTRLTSTMSYLDRQINLQTAMTLEADVSYLGTVSGSTKNRLELEIEKNKNEVSVWLDASMLTHRIQANFERVKPAFEAYLDAKRIDLFERDCGSKMFTTEIWGAQLLAKISISNVDEKERKSWHTEIEGEGGYGPLSASAQFKFDIMLSKHSGFGQVKVELYQRGGQGLVAISSSELLQTVATPNIKLAKVIQKIEALLAQFSEHNATPLYLVGSSIPGIRLADDTQFASRTKLIKLAAIKDKYQLYEKMRALYEPAVQAKFHSVLGEGIAMQETQAEYYAELVPFLARLKKIHKKCRNASANRVDKLCGMPKVPSLALLWMNLDLIFNNPR